MLALISGLYVPKGEEKALMGMRGTLALSSPSRQLGLSRWPPPPCFLKHNFDGNAIGNLRDQK